MSFFCHKLCAGKCWVKLKFCLPNICWPATVVGRVKICILLEIRRVAVLPISVAVAKQAVFGELGAACWSTEMVLLPRQSNGTWNFLKMGKEEILGGLMDWKEYLVEEGFYWFLHLANSAKSSVQKWYNLIALNFEYVLIFIRNIVWRCFILFHILQILSGFPSRNSNSSLSCFFLTVFSWSGTGKSILCGICLLDLFWSKQNGKRIGWSVFAQMWIFIYDNFCLWLSE